MDRLVPRHPIFLILLSILATPVAVAAFTGDLDPTFGRHGRIDLGLPREWKVSGLAPLRSGGILAAARPHTIDEPDCGSGSSAAMVQTLYRNESSPETSRASVGLSKSFGRRIDFLLARYRANGRLDERFGSDGLVSTDFGFAEDFVEAIAVQPNGRILAAGTSCSTRRSSPTCRGSVARYLPDGTLDRSFGTGGRLTLEELTSIGAIAVDREDRILLAGSALARLRPDGELDPSFGNGGVVEGAAFLLSDAGEIVVQRDGRVLALGWSCGGIDGRQLTYAVVRYTREGAIDSTFGWLGAVDVDYEEALALQRDGRMVVAGTTCLQTGQKIACGVGMRRIKKDGAPDRSFGRRRSGETAGPFLEGGDIFAESLALHPDGKLTVAGTACAAGASCRIFLARYLGNGRLDATFGSNGTILGREDAQFDALAIQEDGNAIIADSSPFTRDAHEAIGIERHLSGPRSGWRLSNAPDFVP